jgi:hypothetical protein
MLEEQAAPEETTSDTLLDQASPTLNEGEYFLSEGIKGAGDMPEWYNPSKYKSVSEQAKAYTELEKKFGGFTGAPKDGYSGPEGIESDDVLLSELTEFANNTNMSQDAFNDAWQLLSTQGEVAEEYNQEQELSKLGDNAQQRIKTVEGFMKNNMSADDFESARSLVTSAESVQLIEMLVKATAPTKLPIEGGESPTGLTWSDIESEMFKKDEQGGLLRSSSVSHDAKIKQMMQDYGGNTPHHRTVG